MKCPSCNAQPMTPTMQAYDTGVAFGRQWKCIAFCCPKCKAILSTGIDPVVLKAEIVRDVVAELKS